MQLKPKLYVPGNIFGNIIEMRSNEYNNSHEEYMTHAPYHNGYLGADATPPIPPETFYEKHKNAIIVGSGCAVLAVISALFIHHAGKVHREKLANSAVKKNPKLELHRNMFIPQHIKDYAKASAKLAPDHLRYYKGALGF